MSIYADTQPMDIQADETPIKILRLLPFSVPDENVEIIFADTDISNIECDDTKKIV